MRLDTNSKNKLFISITCSIFLFGLLFILNCYVKKYNSPKEKILIVQEKIYEKEVSLEKWVGFLSGLAVSDNFTDSVNSFFSPERIKSLDNEDIALFFYSKDSLVFWTSNKIIIPTTFDSAFFSKPFFLTKNAWVLNNYTYSNGFKIVGVSMVKNHYNHSNRILRNSFSKSLTLSEKVKISEKPSKYNIFSKNKQFLFSLEFPKSIDVSSNYSSLLFITFCLFVISSIYCLRIIIFTFLAHQKISKMLLFTLASYTFAFLILFLKFPYSLFQTELFLPYFYSSTLIPSFGALFVLMLIAFESFWLSSSPLELISHRIASFRSNYFLALLHTALAVASIFAYIYFLYHLLHGLDANFAIDNFLSFTSKTVLLIIVFCLAVSLAFFFFWRVMDVASNFVSRKKLLQIIGIVLLAACGFFFISVYYTVIGLSLCIVLLIIFLNLNPQENPDRSLFFFILMFFALSFGSALALFHTQLQKERMIQKLQIQNISQEPDPFAEALFSDIHNNITTDSTLAQLVLESDFNKTNPIRNYLRNKYFLGFWNRYRIYVHLSNNQDSSILTGKNTTPSTNPHLQFWSPEWGEISYFSDSFVFRKNNTDSVTLIIQLSRDNFIFRNKITDLMVPDPVLEASYLVYPYCFAYYKNSVLNKKSGIFNYEPTFPRDIATNKEFSFIEKESYEHLVYIPQSKEEIWVISRKKISFSEELRTFSYLFLLFSICGITFYFLNGIKNFMLKQHKNDFKFRLQLVFISLLFTLFLLIGIVSLFFIQQMYNKKNENSLVEKVNFIKEDMTHDHDQEVALLDIEPKQLEQKIKEYSKIYKSDISIFNLSGKIYASSIPSVLRSNLFSDFISPGKLKILSKEPDRILYIPEKLNSEKFTAIFFTLKNKNGDILGFVALTHFVPQDELKSELMTFLSTYAIIYFFFILFSLLAFLFIIRTITKPLRLIQKEMSLLSIQKGNQKIHWRSNDELGELINEYNQMVEKIENNASLLAKSERESGWREIAKEIAHEIKNPLTPMKLSIQHLQRTWKDKSPDFEKRIEQTSAMLIEQIDLLANIAEEFSDLARLPSSNMEKIDLCSCINSAIELAKQNEILTFDIDLRNRPHHVFADKRQLIRVFVNLFKNAGEAIPKDKNALITISIQELDEFYEIRIQDNGIGIPAKEQENIFRPYYTTKKQGTGLGLAIIKSIIENTGGNISFESEENVGTVFIIQFPILFDESEYLHIL